MSNYVYVTHESYEFLTVLKEKYPHYSDIVDTIALHLSHRLWNQLSDCLIIISEKKDLQLSTDLIELYNRLILHIESAFNPMKLMILIKNIVKNFSTNLQEALIFLENIGMKIEKNKSEEYLFLNLLKGFCFLNLNELYKCEEIILSTKSELEKRFEVDQLIYSNLYCLSTLYYEKKQNYDEYYNNALQYLAYANQIENEEKINICYKMSISCLIGEKMFNFAELIEKEFLKVLLDTEYKWIYDLIICFNSANVEQFLSMMEKYSNQVNSDKILHKKVEFLNVKIRITALLDLIFQKNKNERILSYKEISERCLCDSQFLEILLIKALSLGLIRGFIDEVDNKVIINWVQPKYLDKDKINILHDRLEQWISKTNKVLGNFQETAHQLLV